jgi:C4-dicarboxylate transporter DctM subunit
MSWQATLLLYVLLLGGAIALGVPIVAAMSLVGLVGITLLEGTRLWPSLGDIVWNTVNAFSLTAIPLFVLMGEIILRSGASRRFYQGISVLLSRLPGGLAQANILACALFSAISGSSTATALTIGTVALPEMRRRGYADTLTFGTLTGGGALGNLIPPSIFLLVYAALVQESVIDLFIATIVPGLIAVLMFMVYVAWRALRDPTLVPPKAEPYAIRECLRALWQCVPVTGLIVSIIGGMYYGVVTPTEAAGFGCLVALILALAYRELTWQTFQTSLTTSIAISSVVVLIIVSGSILNYAVVQSGIARNLAEALVSLNLSSLAFFTLLFVLYLVLGTFLDGVSMMLLTLPVLMPSLEAMKFNLVWFGVILVIQSELAQLSPPVGLNLFAVQSIAGDAPMSTVAWASLPYALMLCALTFLLYFQPDLAMWLVTSMKN